MSESYYPAHASRPLEEIRVTPSNVFPDLPAFIESYREYLAAVRRRQLGH